ncbi:MAG: ATP cone domain-containing protein, partial [Erysipelotrichaceae bacterium]
MVIIKRDGNLQEYSSEKIKNAIRKVFASEGRISPENDLQDIIFSIENSIEVKASRNEPVTVEWIQDMVEIELMKKEYFKEVRSYIIYRDEHARTREAINNIVDMLGIKKIGPVLK